MLSSIIHLFFVLTLQNALADHVIAKNDFSYDFEKMVQFIVEHSPQEGTWNGKNFQYRSLFTSPIKKPHIELVTPEGMLIAAGGQAPGVVALYDSDIRTMFLAEDIKPDSIEGYSIILHELVHHMQNEMGLTNATKCPMNLEHDAYRIQLIYLNQKQYQDTEFYKIMKLSSLISGHSSICYKDFL